MHINSPFFEQTIATTLQSTERRNTFHFELLSNLHGMSNTNKLEVAETETERKHSSGTPVSTLTINGARYYQSVLY